jgi:hypothetical protein
MSISMRIFLVHAKAGPNPAPAIAVLIRLKALTEVRIAVIDLFLDTEKHFSPSRVSVGNHWVYL